MEIKKNWDNTIKEIPGTLVTDKDGKVEFKKNQYGKYSIRLKVMEDDPWAVLERKALWIFVDGLRESDVKALKKLEDDGRFDGETRVVITGHLVRTAGNPGMNDLLNLKWIKARPEAGKTVAYTLEDALSKDEWQVIYTEKKTERDAALASAAPAAPVAPTAPF